MQISTSHKFRGKLTTFVRLITYRRKFRSNLFYLQTIIFITIPINSKFPTPLQNIQRPISTPYTRLINRTFQTRRSIPTHKRERETEREKARPFNTIYSQPRCDPIPQLQAYTPLYVYTRWQELLKGFPLSLQRERQTDPNPINIIRKS